MKFFLPFIQIEHVARTLRAGGQGLAPSHLLQQKGARLGARSVKTEIPVSSWTSSGMLNGVGCFEGLGFHIYQVKRLDCEDLRALQGVHDLRFEEAVNGPTS